MDSMLLALQELKDKQDAEKRGIFYSMKTGQNWLYVVANPADALPIKVRKKHGLRICRKHTNGERCYGCEAVADARRRGNEAFAKKWNAKDRGYFWAVPKSVLKDKQKAGEELTLEDVKLVEVSGGVQKDIVSQILAMRRNPFRPDDMQCLCITRVETGDQFKYKYTASFGEETDMSSMITPDFLSQIPLLDEQQALQAASNEDIRTHMEGGDGKDKPRRQRTVDTSEFDEESAGQSSSGLQDADDGEDLPF